MENINIKVLDDFLGINHFELTEAQDSPDFFGNFIRVWKSPFFSVRLVKDRGEQAIEVSSPADHDNWIDLSLIKEIVEGDSYVNDILQINEAVAFLKGHLSDIQRLLRMPDYLVTQKKLTKIRSERTGLFLKRRK